MKIAQQALILAIGTSTVVQGHSFRKNVETSKVDMRVLMENAKSSTKTKRDLQEADMTGYDSIIFKSCQTLSVETNADSETVQTLVESGVAKGVQSFVEFDVCDSQFCTQEGSRTSYVVPLSDYINAFSEFLPTKQEEYCQGCINNNDYCQIQYYPNTNIEMPTQYYYDQYTQNNGGRRLAQNGVFYEAINCDLCRSYNCMYTENEEYNNRIAWTQENSKAWIQSMSSCYQNQNRPVIVNQDTEASFAFMCNAEGTGVEIGVFLDSDCTIYDSKIHFGDVMAQSDYYFFTQSKANVEYIFENSFSCYDPEINYVSPNQYENLAAQQGNQGQDGEAPEAGEWCTNVFAGNTAPMEFSSCNTTTIDDWAQVDAGESSALSQNDLYDLTAACSYLVAHNGTGQAIYNKKGSGSMYTWSSNKAGSSITSSGSSASGTATGDMETTSSSWWNFWVAGNQGSSSTATDSASANRNWKSTLSQMAADTTANAARTAKAGAKLGTAGIVGIVVAVVVVSSVIAALVYRAVKKDKTDSKEEPMLEKEGETGTLA